MRFRKETGTSIYQYLITTRIEHFAHLLATTDLPVMDIACQAGFKDCSNIARIFKKYKGCSPLEFRQKNCVF